MSTQITSFRLSPQQRRVWQLQRGGGAHFVQSAFELEGGLDKDALRRALGAVVNRHEALRTSIHHPRGTKTPLQVVADDDAFAWRVQSADGEGPGGEEAGVARLLEEDRQRTVGDAQSPPLRASLLSLSPRRHVLALTLPAYCADTQTVSNLLDEVIALLGGGGRPSDDETLQYAHISEWQHELLEAEETAAGREFWRGQDFDGLLDVELPAALAPRPDAPFAPRCVSVAAGATLARRLSDAAARCETTPAAFLFACWAALIWRLTGREELVVGELCDGRDYEELRGACGLLAKVVPVRAGLGGRQRFRELLARVEASRRDARQWQTFFSWEACGGGAAAGDEDAVPFCALGFSYEEALTKEGAGLRLKPLGHHAYVDRFTVQLRCEADGGGDLRLHCEYDAGRLGEGEAWRLLAALRAVLASAADDPERAVGDLDFLGAEERRRLLVEWNDTAADYPRDKCAHQLLEEQAARTPDAVALVYRDEQLSYRELHRRADLLARRLRRAGVGPGSLVGILMERSAEMVVSLLAVLKAGGAYVPLDPSNPPERTAFMLKDTGAEILLAQDALRESVPACDARTICPDAEWAEMERAAAQGENPADETAAGGPTPDDLAYVIYTSGSTGRPKGVMVTHRGLVNYLSWAAAAYRVGEGSGAPVHSPLSFDLSVTSLFLPMLAGRRVVLIPEADGLDGLHASLIAREDFSLVKLTPAHLDALGGMLRTGGDGHAVAGSARSLVIGGEALQAESLRLWRERAPQTRLVNEYGPTETVVGCCVYEVRDEDPPSDVVPIGRPIANTTLYVLDERGRPTPVGVAGELHIGGAGLARGYLGRPGLTAERFVPDPFGSAAGARLYRTGDQARYLPDGRLEFLGRLDHQVKIRGHRVELGEIEAALLAHDAVEQCAALTLEEQAGGKRVVAFYVPRRGAEVLPAELRRALRERLPEYMVPGAFVALPALPLTPNGKVDRKALLAVEVAGGAGEAAEAAHANPIEEMLSLIFARLLGRERVGPADNFFESGGHSLLAVQAAHQIYETFGVAVRVSDLFKEPTVGGLARVVGAAMGAERRLASAPIERAARGASVPLSYAQQRLWFLQQLTPESPAYNIASAVRLRGRLDAVALERTLNEVVRRHETLRTVFTADRGTPAQLIHPALTLPLPVIDIGHLPEAGREAEVARLTTEEARRPFDLSAGPLLRATLLRLAPSEHVLLVTMHHIVSDGWSMDVLVREMVALYEPMVSGDASPLPELPIQYADYAGWQRRELEGEVLESQLAYWKQKLAGAAPLELPTDFPRPVMQTHRGARVPFTLTPALSEQLRALSRREGATLFMTLLAAFQALLHRYTGQEDVSVGVTLAGRDRIETRGLIGFFVNTLPLRTDLSGGPTFRELLGRVRAAALETYAHQDLPFEKLVEELHIERSLSQTPLFNVVLDYQSEAARPAAPSQLSVSPLPVENQTSKFDLVLTARDTAEGIAGSIEYATDLFEPATIERMLGHFETLLGGFAARPEARVTELPFVGEAELALLLRAGNDTPATFPADLCLHTLFEQQAALTPDAVALTFQQEQLSYGQLNARANRLARRLRRSGVGPETLVAVYVERSTELVVSLLAVLKAGGAYVPLNPAHPRERLAFIIEDARAHMLLTQRALRDGLPDCDAPVILADDEEAFAGEGEDDLPGHTPADGVAYVIYTSGSTGQPKGVSVTHANVVRLFAATRDWFGFGAGDVWTMFHSAAFDFSVWEMWGALLYGGRLVVVPYWVSRSTEAFVELVREQGVTVLNQTPSAFRQFIQAERQTPGPPQTSLRVVIFGGEALELQSLKPWVERHGDRAPQLVNMYGITETTVHVTYQPLDASQIQGATGSIIGRPIPDLQVYVMDEHLNPAPLGVKGEMYVGGAGLARGYLGRPALTAERFIPNPRGASAGARLYRTGDLARYRADGSLEYLGRIDHQVKVRGYRIELGEIEATLTRHPQVDEAVVLATDGAGGANLVAYFVPGGQPAPTRSEVRNFLKEKLPDYMIPHAFVSLDKLPLTPNGKLDRQALLAVERTGDAPEREFVAPRTEVEKILADAWREVLGVEKISIHDNFFELGGDSILSIQSVARATQAGVAVTPKQVFQYQTIAGLAEVAGVPAAAAPEESGEGEFPLTPIQQWFFEQELTDAHHYNQAVMLEASREVGPDVLRRAWQHLFTRHDSLRLRFEREGDGWRQHVAEPGDVPFALLDLSAVPESELSAALSAKADEFQASLNLSEGPLARVVLFDRGPGKKNLLFVVIHHLAVDGVSWRVLFDELEAACAQLLRGEEIALPPPPATSYRRWAQRLGAFARSAELREEAAYWLEALRGPHDGMPLDRPDGVNDVDSSRTLIVEFDAAETRALLREVPRAYRTQIHEVLLAALALAYGGWGGRGRVLVDVEGHGREELFAGLDLSRTVGWFTAVYPVLLDAGGAGGEGATLKAVKEQWRRVPRGGLGYGLLRYLCDDESLRGQLAALPPPQLCFNYLGQFDQSLPASALFGFTNEPVGRGRSPRVLRRHVLEINSNVVGGQLRMAWEYSENLHDRATIERLARGFAETVRALIEHCLSSAAGGYTPSDFPEAGLNQQELDDVLAELDGIAE